jgi:flagellum-specific ATP synthase
MLQLYSAYYEHRDLISVGAYQKGSVPDVDHALRRLPSMRQFLQQNMNISVNLRESIDHLVALPEEVDMPKPARRGDVQRNGSAQKHPIDGEVIYG